MRVFNGSNRNQGVTPVFLPLSGAVGCPRSLAGWRVKAVTVSLHPVTPFARLQTGPADAYRVDLQGRRVLPLPPGACDPRVRSFRTSSVDDGRRPE